MDIKEFFNNGKKRNLSDDFLKKARISNTSSCVGNQGDVFSEGLDD